jgi:DNA-binding GntR family transcriptional regulator
MLEIPNLPSTVARMLREEILDGSLGDGLRLNEVALAARLGVSRTPLREALSRLVAEGFVEHLPRRGFFVRPLTAEEAGQIYPIRAILDPEALCLAGVPPPERRRELRRINRELGSVGAEPEATLELDERWHRTLIRDCPNRELLRLIDRYIERTRRYELAYFRSLHHVAVVVDEHARILDALDTGALDTACEALRENMRSAVAPILDWLATRETAADRPSKEAQ